MVWAAETRWVVWVAEMSTVRWAVQVAATGTVKWRMRWQGAW